MITEEQILDRVLKGTTEFRHRRNPKRQRIVHIAKKWAIMQVFGTTYGCGYGPTYVSGCLRVLLIPEDLRTGGGIDIWDSARDKQGAVTKKRLARIVEVVTAELKGNRGIESCRRARDILEREFGPIYSLEEGPATPSGRSSSSKH